MEAFSELAAKICECFGYLLLKLYSARLPFLQGRSTRCLSCWEHPSSYHCSSTASWGGLSGVPCHRRQPGGSENCLEENRQYRTGSCRHRHLQTPRRARPPSWQLAIGCMTLQTATAVRRRPVFFPVENFPVESFVENDLIAQYHILFMCCCGSFWRKLSRVVALQSMF
jgi:hypothetical protein